MNEVLNTLNSGSMQDRLAALEELMISEKQPHFLQQYANNHIHTFYSFSPYSPTAAVYYARQAGLPTAGIMDHDSIAGAEEFIAAGKIAGVATTVGIECRVSVAGTPLEGKRINNPDQLSVAYMALHGVPHTQLAAIQNFFAPYREKRNNRNREIVKKINNIIAATGIKIDFDKDVIPTSRFNDGGSVTERHLLYTLALKLIEKVGLGNPIIDVITNELGILLTPTQQEQLRDINNPYYEYDLLGIFKGSLVEKVFVEATDECMHISQLIDLAQQTGALLCYPYLGDVGNSVTGDKKTQKFEDDFLDELFEVLAGWRVDAITYMPSRNTPQQLKRLQDKCKEYNLFEISGEDINTPRQKFICNQLAQPEFSHLISATWSLIDYELKATDGPAEKPNRSI